MLPSYVDLRVLRYSFAKEIVSCARSVGAKCRSARTPASRRNPSSGKGLIEIPGSKSRLDMSRWGSGRKYAAKSSRRRRMSVSPCTRTTVGAPFLDESAVDSGETRLQTYVRE